MSRRMRLLGVLATAFVIACDDEVTQVIETPDPLDPAAPPHVVSTYPPDGGIGPFELYRPYGAGRPHFILHFDKLIDPSRFESRWLRMEGFDSPVEFHPTSYSNLLTDALAITVGDSATHEAAIYRVGRTYTVTVDTTFRDATGSRPAAPHRFAFVPEPAFRVLAVDFERGQPVWSTARVRLAWNAVPGPGIETSIRFDPPVEGTWSGSDDARVFIHTQPFAFGRSYVLHVDSTATDAEGNRMAAPFSTTFQVRPFRIEATYPADGWSGILPLDRRIFVAVSGPIDTTSVPAAFSIEPALAGRFVWGTTSFAFTSTSDLQPSTRYRVEISTALRAWDGTALETPYVFSFTTDSFSVVGSEPFAGAIEVALSTMIEVHFNMELDPATLEPAFTISPPVSGQLTAAGGVLQFRSAAPLAPATLYEVTITTALRSANGAPFLAPYTFSFTTRMFRGQATASPPP